MQCVTPMFRRYRKGDHKTGTVVPRSEVLNRLIFEPNYIRDCLNKVNKNNNYYQYEQIPCKKCWACQLNYSREWATRMMLEAKKSDYNFFITLTYDDEHVPILKRIETVETYQYYDKQPETNNVIYENDGTWGYSLLPEDMARFINSLKRYFHRKGITGIKYFYCGEYGETTHRPHYHLILMNCPLDINYFYGTHIDDNFKAHFKSKEVEAFWSEPCEGNTPWEKRTPLGMIDISELEWSAAAYVARYCTKKISFNLDKREYYKIGKLPEFIRPSKNIGMDYFNDHKDEIYKTDEIIMRTVKGNLGSCKPPKAFDRKFQELDPEGFKLIQESRKHAAERSREIEKQMTDITDHKKLIIKTDKLKTKMQMLPRVGEW